MSYLAEFCLHASIKVYLNGVHSMHIEAGFPNPLRDKLCLHKVLHSIKRCKGRPRPKRLPITLNILDVIHSSFHFDHYDDAILWAACCLVFFGFLHCAEFTINGRFNTQVHLSIGDIAVDHSIHSTCILVFIKASKTDPFREGVSNNNIGCSGFDICGVTTLLRYLHLRGSQSGLLFLFQDGEC